jgi:hypothetical protein
VVEEDLAEATAKPEAFAAQSMDKGTGKVIMFRENGATASHWFYWWAVQDLNLQPSVCRV